LAIRFRTENVDGKLRFFKRDTDHPEQGEVEVSEEEALGALANPPPSKTSTEPPKGKRTGLGPLGPGNLPQVGQAAGDAIKRGAKAAAKAPPGEDAPEDSPEGNGTQGSSSGGTRRSPSEESLLEKPAFWGLVLFGGVTGYYLLRRK